MPTFGNRNAVPATPAPAAARKQSRYSGISGAHTRDPFPKIGTYRAKVIACVEGYNPGKGKNSYKVTLSLLAAEPGSESAPGETVVALFNVGKPAGLSRLMSFAVSAAGFGPTLTERRTPGVDYRGLVLAGEAQYNAIDDLCEHGSGSILEASAGHSVLTLEGKPAPTLVGRVVDVIVTKGNEVMAEDGAPTGDYYREYTWGSVPDADQ